MRPDEIRAHHLQEKAKEAPSILEEQDFTWIVEELENEATAGKFRKIFRDDLILRFTPRIKKHLEYAGFKVESFYIPEWKRVLYDYIGWYYLDGIIVSWEVQK